MIALMVADELRWRAPPELDVREVLSVVKFGDPIPTAIAELIVRAFELGRASRTPMHDPRVAMREWDDS